MSFVIGIVIYIWHQMLPLNKISDMTYLQTITNLEMIELAKKEIESHRGNGNPLLGILEVMTELAERSMGPKPKPKTTWSQVWDRFDTFIRCDR